MAWVRFDDGFWMDDRVASLSHGAFRLWVQSIAFSNQTLSDGTISVPSRSIPGPKRVTVMGYVRELEEAGLWTQKGPVWVIKNYHRFQPSKAEILRQRELAAERKRKQREKSRRDSRGTFTVTDGVTVKNVTPSVPPYPPRPDPPPTGGRVGGRAHTRAREVAERLREIGCSGDLAVAILRAEHPKHGRVTLAKVDRWIDRSLDDPSPGQAVVFEAVAEGFEVPGIEGRK